MGARAGAHKYNFCRDKQTRVCRDKYTFVATKDVFCGDKHVFFATNTKIMLVVYPANDSWGRERREEKKPENIQTYTGIVANSTN